MTLQAYWPLTEDSGDVLDYSGNENHGDASNVTLGDPGILGETAPTFGGSSISIPYNSSIAGSPVITCSGWIYHTDTSNHDYTFVQGSGNDNNMTIGFRVNGSNGLRVQVKSSDTWYCYNSNISTAESEWAHVTLVYNSAQNYVRYYINAEEIYYGTSSDCYGSGFPTPPSSDTQTARIGPLNDGKMNDLRLYTRELSPHEVQYLYRVPFHGTLTTEEVTL